MRRFKDSISLAALSEKPAALAIIQLDGVTDVAHQIIARHTDQAGADALLEQVVQAARHVEARLLWQRHGAL